MNYSCESEDNGEVEEKIYECPRCKKTWTKRSNYLRHLRRKNPCKLKAGCVDVINVGNNFVNKIEIKNIIDAVNEKMPDNNSKYVELLEEVKMLKSEIQKLRENNAETSRKIEKIQNVIIENITVKNTSGLFADKQHKVKKQSISQALKKKVWDKHFTIKVGQTKCPCCEITDIEQASFACGHIISEHNGGMTDVDNLIPICTGCNSSMNTQNYTEFKKTLSSKKKTESNKIAIIKEIIEEMKISPPPVKQVKPEKPEKIYACKKCGKVFKSRTVKYTHQLKCDGVLKVRRGDLDLNNIFKSATKAEETTAINIKNIKADQDSNNFTLNEIRKIIKEKDEIIKEKDDALKLLEYDIGNKFNKSENPQKIKVKKLNK